MNSGSPLLSVLFVLLAALIAAAVLVRIKQPTIIGFILGGIAIGPNGLGLVPYHDVELLAEIGVGLLMFTIGIELSIHELLRVKYISIFGGGMLLVLTTVASLIVAAIFGYPRSEAVLWGLCLGLSSTVVVLKLLAERGEIGSTHGNISTGILLFQDVAAVPMIVFLPVLLGGAGSAKLEPGAVGMMLVKFFVAVVGLYAVARYLVPRFLKFVASVHSKELFSISILCLSLGIAGLTHQLGLSLALGAFLAGLVVSESDFGNQAASEVLPLKDAFSAIFFVSIGMLLDLKHVAAAWPTLLGTMGAIILLKFVIIFGIVFAFRYPVKIATFVALALAQIGEFSFLLLQMAQKEQLISPGSYQLLLGNAILTILATPYLVKSSGRVKKVFAFLNKTRWITRGVAASTVDAEEQNEKFSDHVIICGCGPTGSIVMKKLHSIQVPVVIVDLNYKAIQQLKSERRHAIYGDSSSTIVLRAANIHSASLLVVTIPDPVAMRALVRKVKSLRPDLPIILRVKYMSDRDELLALGADDIVWEEFESGQELTRRVLSRLKIS